MKIGLTGAVGAGKSAAARFFHELGARTLDADELAHVALQDAAVKIQLRKRFGEDIFAANGTILAKELAKRAFSDAGHLRQLTDVVYPVITARLAALLNALPREQSVVVEAPTLFEAGCEGLFDAIVTVEAPEASREARCQAQRGWQAGEATRRESFKLAAEERRRRSAHVIENEGTLADLKARVTAIWRALGLK